MADKIILVDTSILIDFYRKTDKNNAFWIGLIRQGYSFAISVITKYEIYAGATNEQLQYWDSILQAIDVIPFDQTTVNTAVAINRQLKKKRMQIDLADLFIATTAITHQLPFSTLNKKHFDRIDGISLIN